MSRSPRRRRSESQTAQEARASRLGGVRTVPLDDEERPSREDRTYGETIFNRAAVPLPGFLTGRRKRPRK